MVEGSMTQGAGQEPVVRTATLRDFRVPPYAQTPVPPQAQGAPPSSLPPQAPDPHPSAPGAPVPPPAASVPGSYNTQT
ncbi:serine/threonine protein phosphatase, partial [Streptomyces sp. NE06-03C]|nr:serine/threonine protein phosphatase [Streptomyces sp. NE06-03C]